MRFEISTSTSSTPSAGENSRRGLNLERRERDDQAELQRFLPLTRQFFFCRGPKAMMAGIWLTLAVVGMGLPSSCFSAEQGYVFKLERSVFDAQHDPDGIWGDDELAFIRKLGFVPMIYTAHLSTPKGEWLLSQTNGDCNPQGMCTTLLHLRKAGGNYVMVANPQMPLGGRAVLSLNYRKIYTQEINQSGRGFEGVYDVDPNR